MKQVIYTGFVPKGTPFATVLANNNKMRQISILTLVIILFSLHCFAQNTKVNDNDKLLIIRHILNNSDFQSDVGNEQIIYLSSENLPDSFSIKKDKVFGRVKIELLSSDEIDKRIKEGLSYRYFESFETKGNALRFIFSKVWINSTYYSRTGTKYECRKNRRKMRCKISGLVWEQS